MSGVKSTTAAILMTICISPVALTATHAADQWTIQTERYLDVHERCVQPHEIEAHARHSYKPNYSHRKRYREGYRPKTRPDIGPARYTSLAAESDEVSCIQGTQLVRDYGFHHVEVVVCNERRHHIYEALRGRRPWRIKLGTDSGEIIQAGPLN